MTTSEVLGETDKARIIAEEHFRIEVRRSIEGPKSKAQRLVAFFGSSLGIWLLSTVAVGFFSWAYTQYAQSKETTIRRTEEISRIDIELKKRLRMYSASIQALEVGAYDYSNNMFGLHNMEYPSMEAFNTLPTGATKNPYVPTLSLLFDLSGLVKDGPEKEAVSKLIPEWISFLEMLRQSSNAMQVEDRNHELCDFVGRRLAEEKIVMASVPALKAKLELFRLERWRITSTLHSLDLFLPVTANSDASRRAGIWKGEEDSHPGCKKKRSEEPAQQGAPAERP